MNKYSKIFPEVRMVVDKVHTDPDLELERPRLTQTV